jgi:hypothetical protein
MKPAGKDPNRVGDWCQTFSGVEFYIQDPLPEDINIIDIAHALSHICRYNGHCSFHYSVAQHSALVAQLVPKEFALPALLHDAHEAYTGDIVSPLKPAFKEVIKDLEYKLNVAIATRWAFDPILLTHPEVRKADLIMLSTEHRDIIPAKDPRAWDLLYPPSAEISVKPITIADAYKMFLVEFRKWRVGG